MLVVKNILKLFVFYVLLALYAIFIPFVFINCSKMTDDAYIVVDDEDASDAEKLAECQSSEFLTADCVALIQAEDERIDAEDAAIAAALEAAEAALDCMTGETSATTSTSVSTSTGTGTSTTTTTTITVTDCVSEEDAESIIGGNDACLSTEFDTTQDNDECPDIEEDYTILVTDCGNRPTSTSTSTSTATATASATSTSTTTTLLPDDFCDTLVADFNEPSADNVDTE